MAGLVPAMLVEWGEDADTTPDRLSANGGARDGDRSTARHDVSKGEGFRRPAATNVSPRTSAGVRKPPRDETAGRGTYWAVPRAQLCGFGSGRATAEVGEAIG